jgi:hypothetical protein
VKIMVGSGASVRWVTVILVAGLAGSALAGPPVGFGYRNINAADVPKLKFAHYFTPNDRHHSADFEWTFSEKSFNIAAGKGSIPAHLLEKFTGGAAANSITGAWSLKSEGAGVRLAFTDLKVDGKSAPNKAVELPIYPTAPTVFRIGEPQHVFGLTLRPAKPKENAKPAEGKKDTPPSRPAGPARG